MLRSEMTEQVNRRPERLLNACWLPRRPTPKFRRFARISHSLVLCSAPLLLGYTRRAMATDLTTLGHDSVKTPVENSLRPARRFQFGVFHVDVSNGDVRKQGSKIKLQEKPFPLLVLLLEHAGRITTREELRHGLWSADTFVDFDANLKTTVNKLRQVLGDSAESPIFIETIPRRGYRFLPPVARLESRSLAAAPAAPTVAPVWAAT